jgi:hypothetical protein
MLKSVWILLPVALATSAASAEIYKCQTKDGSALYQNFPCPIDSLGSLPSVAAVAKAVPVPKEAAEEKARTAPSELRPNAKPMVSGGEPKVGMTPEEVRSLWGEPANIYWDELVDGRAEIWTFDASRSVQFDLSGKVSLVQR